MKNLKADLSPHSFLCAVARLGINLEPSDKPLITLTVHQNNARAAVNISEMFGYNEHYHFWYVEVLIADTLESDDWCVSRDGKMLHVSGA